MQKHPPFVKLGALAVTGWLFCAPGCSRKDASRLEPSNSPGSSQEPSHAAASAFENNLPHVGGPAGYTSSKACRSCHEEQYGSWHRSYHRTMTQIASADSVQADFHNVALTNEGVRFVLSQKSNELWVRMERPSVGSPGESAPETLDVRFGLVTGSHHMQVFWVPGGEGNTQIGFPFTWLIAEKRWVPRNSTFVRPPGVVHRSEVWNVICSRCHATGIEPRVDSGTHTMDTRVGELGIACEACHGPGQRHVQARLAAEKDKATPPDTPALRSEIVHPKKIDPTRAAQICGFCHSMKWFDRSEAWLQNGFRYRPGDDLEQTTPIIRPSRVAAVPALADYLARNPDLLRDFFWSDGMIRVSGREYNGLLESPCYKGGKFSCLSCHSLHESEPNAQLSARGKDNRACTQCHQQFGEESVATAHTHHRAVSSGSQCYNCHMPHTAYGILKAIRSHHISSPRVADDLATGRPNACNLCHLDKPLNWTADHLQKWYGQQKPALADDIINVSHAVRLALSGDAGQRVLAAWHMGWPPALEISHTNWMAPILGQLLDDPYAAVRCVAERSLKKHTAWVARDYDYTLDPKQRQPARGTVWESWARQAEGAELPESKSHLLLVWPKDLEAQQRAFDPWLRLRDERPVRLRE